MIGNTQLVLVKNPRGFYKLKLDYKYYDNGNDPGGLDIFSTDFEFKDNPEIDEILNDKNNLHLIRYHTVPNYALKKDKAEHFLNTHYGKDWKREKTSKC